MPAGLTVVALAVVLTACGSSAVGSSVPDAASSGTVTGPVTISHRYGSTTVEQPPRRIVSLDPQWTDVLVALDAPVVGAVLDPRVPGGRYPWQAWPPEVQGIPVTDSIPFEAMAALQPDLIVVSWAARRQADYEKLTQIAPTIPQLGAAEVDQWQAMADVGGRVLGQPDRARRVTDEADRLATDLAAQLPGLKGKTYALANYVPGDGIYVVTDPDDGAARFFTQLGMAVDPDLVGQEDGGSGRTKLSLERVDALDADLLLLLTNGADAGQIVGYGLLPAVQDGAVADIDLATATGLNTPTPLALPYAIDRIRPALQAAAT